MTISRTEILLAQTLIYAQRTRRNAVPGNLIAATCLLLLSLHVTDRRLSASYSTLGSGK
jgi:hypothetical protein